MKKKYERKPIKATRRRVAVLLREQQYEDRELALDPRRIKGPSEKERAAWAKQ